MEQEVGLEQQLHTLAEFGIGLAEGVGVELLEQLFDRELYELEPWLLLLTALGSDSVLQPNRRLGQGVWLAEAERLEADPRELAELPQRLGELTGGRLELGTGELGGDPDSGPAWFDTGEEPGRRLPLLDSAGRLEPGLAHAIAELLSGLEPELVLVELALEGRDMLLLCLPGSELERLRSITGLDLRAVEPRPWAY